MIRRSISRALLAVSIVAGTAGAAVSVLAGSTGNGTAGFGLPQYKDLAMYRNEADAQRLCKGDTVVWGSSQNIGIYFIKGHGPYYDRGSGPQRIGGFYACMNEAKNAGYKIE